MAFLISSKLKENVEFLNQVLHVDECFDLLYQTFEIGGKQACIYYINGFMKDDVLQKLLQTFEGYKEEDIPQDLHSFMKKKLPYVELNVLSDEDSVLKNILSGITILLMDGYPSAIAIDCRNYPARGVEEPEKDLIPFNGRKLFRKFFRAGLPNSKNQ